MPANVASVPVVGRVTLVDPVVVKVKAFEAVKVRTSPPAKVIELVARVVESDTVKVLPFVIVSVPVDDVRVKPLIEVAVATPISGVVKTGEVDRATEPVPVTAVIAVPLIENELPEPAVSYVLFVNVSVVALPTRVSVAFGKVRVFAVVNVAAIVPVIFVVLPDISNASRFVLSPPSTQKTSVSITDEFSIVEAFIVLLVKVSNPARVARVPVVGRVTFVVPVVVKVKELAPEVMKSAAVVRLPANEMVLSASPVVRVRVLSAAKLLPGFRIKSCVPSVSNI